MHRNDGPEREIGNEEEEPVIELRLPSRDAPRAPEGIPSVLSRRPNVEAQILLAEDDPDIGQVLGDLMNEDGLRVTVTSTGQEALTASLDTTYDLVLLDVGMPGALDGLAVCRALRLDSRYKDTPIVMLTGRDSLQDAEEAFAAGATDYILKPFSTSQLRARVRSLLIRGGVS